MRRAQVSGAWEVLLPLLVDAGASGIGAPAFIRLGARRTGYELAAFQMFCQCLLDREERRLLDAASDVSDGVDEWRALVADAGFVRRSSVLARGAPLHRIDQRQAWQRFPRGLYDPRTLALIALEVVVSRQEMEAEATTEEVIEFLASLAASAAPERAASEHRAVARFVVRELLNDGQHGEEFEVCYSDYREGHRRVSLSLRMLEEGIGRRGQGVLRATTAAINLLLSGLEHCIADVSFGWSPQISAYMRTARRRSSSGYLEGRAMTRSFHEIECSFEPGRFTSAATDLPDSDRAGFMWTSRSPTRACAPPAPSPDQP